jgi:hypothetical protein
MIVVYYTRFAIGRYSFDGFNTPALEPITDYVLAIDLQQPALAGVVPTLSDVASAPNNNTDSDDVVNADQTRVDAALFTQVEGSDYSFDL